MASPIKVFAQLYTLTTASGTDAAATPDQGMPHGRTPTLPGRLLIVQTLGGYLYGKPTHTEVKHQQTKNNKETQAGKSRPTASTQRSTTRGPLAQLKLSDFLWTIS